MIAFKVIPSQLDQIGATQAGAECKPHRKRQARRSLGHEPGYQVLRPRFVFVVANVNALNSIDRIGAGQVEAKLFVGKVIQRRNNADGNIGSAACECIADFVADRLNVARL